MQEMGDSAFLLVNLARWLDVDAESALRGACDRFSRRYAQMEQMARAEGTQLGARSLTELDVLWQRAKALE